MRPVRRSTTVNDVPFAVELDVDRRAVGASLVERVASMTSSPASAHLSRELAPDAVVEVHGRGRREAAASKSRAFAAKYASSVPW